MKANTIVAVLLIVLGIAALAYQRITYTTRETVIDLGPIHAEADRQKTFSLPPVLGITAVGGGILLLVLDGRRV